MTDRERSLATYYAMALRQDGYTPEEAALAVVRRYPGTRAELEQRGLLITPAYRLERWKDPKLAEAMEG